MHHFFIESVSLCVISGSICTDHHQRLYVLTLFQADLFISEVELRTRMDQTNIGFVHLFDRSSSPPHYDWSGLGYIQDV